jgi:hypothetical protein
LVEVSLFRSCFSLANGFLPKQLFQFFLKLRVIVVAVVVVVVTVVVVVAVVVVVVVVPLPRCCCKDNKIFPLKNLL